MSDQDLTFGGVVRHWREVRRFSQSELAAEAQVSARHLSFLENGRARPSRAMIESLASALQLPLRERNTLYTCAGFAPPYPARELDGGEMASIREAIDRMLLKHEPYPAIVMNRCWDLLSANNAASGVIDSFVADPYVRNRERNMMRLMFSPDGLQPAVVNWEEVACTLLWRLYAEAVATADNGACQRLYEQIRGYSTVPRGWDRRNSEPAQAPVLPLRLCRNSVNVELFSVLSVFGTPQDVNVQDIRIEHYYPVSDTTKRLLERDMPMRRTPVEVVLQH